MRFIFIFILAFCSVKSYAKFTFTETSINFTEGQDYYYLTIPIHNAKKENIAISTQKGLLLIEVKNKESMHQNAFRMPFDSDIAQIDVTFNDSILAFKIKKDKKRDEKITLKIK